jgi:phosphohistidine phosphatase
LSEVGERQVDLLARFLAKRGVTVDRVCHSGKRRAEQTAARLAAAVAPGVDLETVADAAPNDPARPLFRTIYTWQEDSLIAGHLPHLSCLAARLLFEVELPWAFDFEPASAACLERSAEGHWSLLWFVSPDLLTQD